MAIFGNALTRRRAVPAAMPGVMSGFGGDTFDIGAGPATMAKPIRGMGSVDVSVDPQPATVGDLVPARPAGAWTAPDVSGAPMLPQGVDMAGNKLHPKFFAKDGAWRDVVGTVADVLAGMGGAQPAYWPQKQRLRLMDLQNKREDAKTLRDRMWAVEDRNYKANQPNYFTVNGDRVAYNPMTGKADVIYNGPEDFEIYAQQMGYEPGSDEYLKAVEDYVLRGNGPSALGYDKQLDDYKTANDKRLSDYRTGNSMKVRGTPTYRDLHPQTKKSGIIGAGNPTPPRAKNAAGQTLELVNGKWVPVK